MFNYISTHQYTCLAPKLAPLQQFHFTVATVGLLKSGFLTTTVNGYCKTNWRHGIAEPLITYHAHQYEAIIPTTESYRSNTAYSSYRKATVKSIAYNFRVTQH
jgi:hypothetical protein